MVYYYGGCEEAPFFSRLVDESERETDRQTGRDRKRDNDRQSQRQRHRHIVRVLDRQPYIEMAK